MDAGAFSDDEVVQAAKDLVAILIKPNRELNNKYEIGGYPTVKFTDPNGKVIDEVDDRSPQAVLAKINAIADKYKGREASMYDAIQSAKEEEKVLLFFFKDNKGISSNVKKALDESIEGLLDKVFLSEIDFEKDLPETKALKVSSAPSIVILNPYIENSIKKPLVTLNGKQEVKSIKTALESAIKECDKAREKNREGEELLNSALESEDAETREETLKDVIEKYKGFDVEKRAKEELGKLKKKKKYEG